MTTFQHGPTRAENTTGVDVVETVERTDFVPGRPDVTAWRRSARLHQHRWRERHGWPVGAMPGGRRTRPVCSRVDESFARERGVNFLHASSLAAAMWRVRPENAEYAQTLDDGRLFCDLLSSMPMCFNLFGPLWAAPRLATAVVHRWFPDLCPADAEVTVRFEWSPGRRDSTWLGDRTAFDVALEITTGPLRRLVGIETKYHEHASPSARRDELKREYARVSEAARLFRADDWWEQVDGSPLEQVWRDHLLALACEQTKTFDQAIYVLVAPSANPVWSETVDRYRSALRPEARASISFRSLDDLVDTVADLLPHTDDFRARYLDVEVAGT